MAIIEDECIWFTNHRDTLPFIDSSITLEITRQQLQRDWITENAAELNQPIYFKYCRPPNGNWDICFIWKRFWFWFHRRRKVINTIKIDKDLFQTRETSWLEEAIDSS